jgi:hypothetical protein
MAKKQSGIAYGQKNLQRGANDTSILISLKTFLRQEFQLEFKREWYVGFDREYGNLCRIAESIGKAELRDLSGKTQTSCVSLTNSELLSLSLTVQSTIEKYRKLSKEMYCFEEQVSNLLSSILPILKSSVKH